MKKIMFNTMYGLEQAVLDGRKTMTRREINTGRVSQLALDLFKGIKDGAVFKIMIDKRAQYKVGEVVAIAQSYNDIIQEAFDKGHKSLYFNAKDIMGAGCNNKMFVKAELMPHHIRITNIRVERLQDISNEDCLREGIRKDYDGAFFVDNPDFCFSTGRRAFSYLIDKVSGKGTWERNPYVFVYEFELVD